MSIRVYVESSATEQVSGTSSKSGKNYCFYKQPVHAFIGTSKFPEKIEISHDSADRALRPGEYTLDVEAALSVDRFGGLGIDARKLVFVPAAPKAATGATASAATTAASK
ncbi:single-stranded DNA-binding protein [Marinobacterium stanieri]|uniref:Single-stranded DNA-binding protein n=1 Tax=Marinobacterium stanieri TaxID=49186 RepID=A0A1N6R7T5_9GAMM|nr:single-stranded DNA-binding protein [Marinobacterium stanieri]SIQ24686.1 Helix-destabilising protein [Marinobacterium stanieri]